MSTTITYAVLTVLPGILWLLFVRLRKWRYKAFTHLPEPGSRSLPLGHLKLIAEGFAKGDKRRHVDYVFSDIVKEGGSPDLTFIDLRPVNFGMLIVGSHYIAEQITRSSKTLPYSVEKSPTMTEGLVRLIGPKSILTEEGDAWKNLRKRFNPGFAPQHLQTLLPAIVEQTTIFMSRLDAIAESGKECEMESLCTDVTFDIIGSIVMNLRFNAQNDDLSQAHEIVKCFKELIITYADNGRIWLWANIPVRIRRVLLSRQTDKVIKRAIQNNFDDIKAAQSTATRQSKDRSILALSLQDTDILTPEILAATADSIKTFLFAGHDTTSILLMRTFYALSLHPKCLAKIRAEHDAIFGSDDPRDVFLARPEETLKALTYTSACMKEVLRLWPPAGSARLAKPGSGFSIRTEEGEEYNVDGLVLYICHYIIQRDPKVYGETADDFVPERWLGDTDTSSAQKDEATGSGTIPLGAWRPFERGPRNCVGQELANIEARVILASVIRRYDFVKVGAGEVEVNEKGSPVLDEKGRYRTKSDLFNSMVVTAKPFDHMRMKVKLRN